MFLGMCFKTTPKNDQKSAQKMFETILKTCEQRLNSDMQIYISCSNRFSTFVEAVFLKLPQTMLKQCSKNV